MDREPLLLIYVGKGGLCFTLSLCFSRLRYFTESVIFQSSEKLLSSQEIFILPRNQGLIDTYRLILQGRKLYIHELSIIVDGTMRSTKLPQDKKKITIFQCVFMGNH